MSLQMALMAACGDLRVFLLLHLAPVTKLTWDRKGSADVAPLHNSWMYSDSRCSPASGEEKTKDNFFSVISQLCT